MHFTVRGCQRVRYCYAPVFTLHVSIWSLHYSYEITWKLLQVIIVLLALCCCAAARKAPRIAVLSMLPGVMPRPPPYMAQTVVNKAMYCNRHDYHIHLFRHKTASHDPASASQSKLLALKTAIMSREHDWILSLNGDVVITSFGTKIESMLPRSQDIDFVVDKNCKVINMGAFIVRASDGAFLISWKRYSVRST